MTANPESRAREVLAAEYDAAANECDRHDYLDMAKAFHAKAEEAGNGGGFTRQVVRAMLAFAALTPPAVEGLRPEVLAFARLMEERLRANDHKPGWKRDAPADLARRVHEESAELSDEAEQWDAHSDNTALSVRIGREAADVANMAMMVADVCGALDATPAAPVAGDMVMVPREPTEAMIQAGVKAWLGLYTGPVPEWRDYITRTFRAMIAASTPPARETVDDITYAGAEVLPEIPDGMVPWHGGHSAPEDWDGGPVLGDDGAMYSPPVEWRRPSGGPDVAAYTPIAHGHVDPIVAAYTRKPVECEPADGGEGRKHHADCGLLYDDGPGECTCAAIASPSVDREAVAQIVARAYGGSLYPGMGTPGDYPTDEVDYRAADAILALIGGEK